MRSTVAIALRFLIAGGQRSHLLAMMASSISWVIATSATTRPLQGASFTY